MDFLLGLMAVLLSYLIGSIPFGLLIVWSPPVKIFAKLKAVALAVPMPCGQRVSWLELEQPLWIL